ncbi:something about silencing protein 10 [Tetranychus urticae]|uniref:Sas10 C-terminal domain-containing protein n=1 Tax=Tetranychus urticae TaxID=32264 RepID=T1K586_TETUR|nr:something about silencing protein 10 [Tetranychus urticae]
MAFNSSSDDVIPVSGFASDDDGEENSNASVSSDSDDQGISSKAWGKKKSVYFGTNYVDKDFRKTTQEEEDLAKDEEEEAKMIQQRILKEIQEDDLDLDYLPDIKEAGETLQEVEIDIDSLSKKEKNELLMKTAPELPNLVEDFKKSLAEMEKHKKVLNYSNVDNIEAYKLSLPFRLFKTKFNLLNCYCMNISFYLLLKSKGKSTVNHPCASNLVKLKKTILNVEKIENKKQFKAMVKGFLAKIATKSKIIMNEEPEDEEMDLRDYDDDRTNQVEQDNENEDAEQDKDETVNSNPQDEPDIELVEYGDLREQVESEEDQFDEELDEEEEDEDEEEEEDEDEDGINVKLDANDEEDDKMDESGVRRPINYQIAKNKGLTPKKRKDQRNPRVAHRRKFKKAKARRKGQVREPRKEIKKYAGEISGIRSTTVKSIKFK